LTATVVEARTPASTAEVREHVRDAAARERRLRIAGGETWLDANRPVRAGATLVMRSLSGIVEYEPGDLTLTARAGTTMDEIARATSAHGQWLALDPFGDPARATLGATIATASSGPLARAFGAPRDVTLARRQERRRIRPNETPHRFVGIARRRDRGDGAPARAAGR